MPLIKFVHNHRDLSTDRGFQFEFYCDICENGYQSTFQASKSGYVNDALDVAGGVLGGIFRTASRVGDKVHSARWEQEHDQAFIQAIEEAKGHFKQCPRCGKWVCLEICWNSDRGLCVDCAPKLAGEIAHAQSEATLEQVTGRVKEKDWTKDLNLEAPAVAVCPNCGADTKGAKFCPECGTPLRQTGKCPRCGAETGSAKFCPECGLKLS